MTFRSSATTVDAWFGDLYTYQLRQLGAEGRVTPAMGVTRSPTGPLPRSGDELVSALRGQMEVRRDTAGPQATAPEQGRLGGYSQRRWDFVSAQYGVRGRVYSPSTGRRYRGGESEPGPRYIGANFNMDHEDARDVWEVALPDIDFDEVYRGNRSISTLQARRLFEVQAEGIETLLQEQGVSGAEHQRIAMFSLALDNPDHPALTGTRQGLSADAPSWAPTMVSAASRYASPEVADIASRISNLEAGWQNIPNGTGAGSTVTGPFQFWRPTWDGMVSQYGQETGITSADWRNPEAQAVMGVLFIRDNYNGLQSSLGRAPEGWEVYAAHFLGLQGARRLLSGDESTPITAIIGQRSLAVNPQVTVNGRAMTFGEVKNFLQTRWGQGRSFIEGPGAMSRMDAMLQLDGMTDQAASRRYREALLYNGAAPGAPRLPSLADLRGF